MTQVTGSRVRTRQAIVDAAIGVLGQNPAATLTEIAAAADVGRTTLHRYFAERSDLLAAVRAEGVDRIDRAYMHARLGEGTGAEAYRRLAREYFELGELLSLIFTEPQLVGDPAWAEGDACDDGFLAMVERGHRDGSIDPELPADWLQSLLWSQLYAGWSFHTVNGTSRQQCLQLVVRTLGGAIAVQPREAR